MRWYYFRWVSYEKDPHGNIPISLTIVNHGEVLLEEVVKGLSVTEQEQ